MTPPLAALQHFPAVAVLLAFVFAGLLAAMWFWALVDCLTGAFNGNEKIVWVLVILFVPLLGSVLYLAIGRGQKITPGQPGPR